MKHLTAAWDELAKTALTPRTWWHVTDDPQFAIDGGYQSMTGADEFGQSSRRDHGGLFITPNPELWLYLWRYAPGKRMYAAEIKPVYAPQMLGSMGGGDDRDQAMLDQDEASQATVMRIVPVEVAIKAARAEGYGFAMLMADLDPGYPMHVVDHKQGWGSNEALCRAYVGGEPIKWTTKDWVLNHAAQAYASHPDGLCPDCLGKLKRQRS